MITSVTAAVAAAALAAILGAIIALLRLSTWPAPAEPSKHGLADHPDAVRPSSWDEVTADHSTTALRDAYVNDSQEIVAPVSAPPVVEEPIDELDPRWDWQAYAESAFLEDWSAAIREDWARKQVADAGHDWTTHMAKFSGAVVERELVAA